MPYTFELTFTGLCIFTFKGDKSAPEEVNVLLVKTPPHGGTHAHLPYLSYSRRDLDLNQVPGSHTLIPNPDGTQAVLHSLTGEDLQIIPPATSNPPLAPIWKTSGTLPPRPANAQQARWLDWVPALQGANPETPSPAPDAPYAGLDPQSVICRVSIKHGSIFATGFRLDSTHDHAIWDFTFPPGSAPVSGTPPTDPPPQALAGIVVVSMENLPADRAVQIKGNQLNLFFLPPKKLGGGIEGDAKVSITNLPAQEGPGQDFLLHFAHFYDPVVWPSSRPPLRVPKKRPGVITSGSSFCPPTTHIRVGS